jgi:hypothetical protein
MKDSTRESLLIILNKLQSISDSLQSSLLVRILSAPSIDALVIENLEDVISRLSDVLGIPPSSPDPEPATEGTDDT